LCPQPSATSRKKVSKIREIQQKLKRLYETGDKLVSGDKPPRGRAQRIVATPSQWVSYAREYALAAEVVWEHGRLFRPWLQLTGHSVECALKACLSAATQKRPWGHDLVDLCDLASKEGFELTDFEMAVAHLGHFYSEDLGTRTRFKSRYPTEKIERDGGAIPDNSVFQRLVESLCEQAEELAQAKD